MRKNRIDVVVGIILLVGFVLSFAVTMYFAFLRDPPVSLPPLFDALGIILATMVLAGPGFDAYLFDFKLTARVFNLLAIWVLSAGFLFLDQYKGAVLLLAGLILLISAGYELVIGWTARPMDQSIADKGV
jgi:hypothetical protein